MYWAIIPLVLTLFMVYFFRDPERTVPPEAGYISPALPAVTKSERETISTNDMWIRDIPKITRFNENPFAFITKKGLSGSTVSAPEPLFDTPGGTDSFYYDSTSSNIPSTCKTVVTDDTKVLNIWVADDC